MGISARKLRLPSGIGKQTSPVSFLPGTYLLLVSPLALNKKKIEKRQDGKQLFLPIFLHQVKVSLIFAV